MKNLKRIIILFILISLLSTTYSQTGQIRSTVINNEDKPLEYFTVAILSPQDSSILTGGAFIDGNFEFSEIKSDKCLLQISCVGYESVIFPVDFTQNSSVDLGSITMKNLELDEVTVLAKRPSFKQVEGRLIIDVKGTALSEAGDLYDALKRSPGLIVDNDNNITVFGKGTPIVFINGREVQNKAEIENLQSDDIASIEIDRNPSVEYSASGNAVVKIETKKITKDKINLQVFSREYFARKFRNLSGMQLNSKFNKTTASVNYSYAYVNAKIYGKSYEINTQENYTISNNNSTIRIPKTRKHNLFVSLNQEINKKNNLGFQYSYISNNRNQNSESDQTISKTNDSETRRMVNKYKHGDNDMYIYNLNYKYDIDSTSSVSIIGDYTRSINRSVEDIQEQNLSNNSNLRSLIDNRNEYDIYGGKIDFKACLFRTINFKTGVKLSKVTNNGRAVSTDFDSYTENYRIVDKINDYISATYFNLKPKINYFNLEAGLRYEYTNTDISSNTENVIDSTYENWFPSILINKEISDWIDATLSYSKKISRPTFNELSTDITYFDSLSYSIGNPAIKPTVIHNIDLSFGFFNHLSVNFAYKYEKNARILGAVSDNANPDIVKYTPVNINKAEYVYVNIDYNYSGKNMNSTLSIGGEKPFIEIPYLDGMRKIRQFSWYFQSNNDYSITSRTSVFANFLYCSSSKDLMTHFDSKYKLSLGLNTSFFDKKLRMSLMANDILNSSDNAWEDKYGNIVAGLNPDNDNTWVRFSIKYSFNDFKGGVRKKSASESELNRL